MDVTTILTENIAVGFVIGFLIGILVKIASKAIRNLLILQLIVIKWLEARNILICRLASIDKWTDWPTRTGPQSNH